MVLQPLLVARGIEQIVKDTFPKNVRLELRCDSQPWTFLGDPNQVHQVLLNLCVNARDAMPSGGKITLRIKNEMIDQTFASMNRGAMPGPYVEISIADTGVGMAPEVRDREVTELILQDLARNDVPPYSKWLLRKRAGQAVLPFAAIDNIA